MILKIKREDKSVPLPRYQTPGSAGMDLHSSEDLVIKPEEYKMVDTGLRMQIPSGYEGQIRPRSGLAAKNGISVLNTPGTADSDYRGVIKVIIINHGKKDFEIKKGDRIAQMIINKVELPQIIEVEELEETQRGEGGLGSTGV